MDKKKKVIAVVAAAVVLVVVIIVGVSIGQNNKKSHTQNITTISNGESGVSGENSSSQESLTAAEDANNKGNKETNYWDNVEVYEETQRQEDITNKNGEKVTEAYPGEQDGWSPIVSPDDLNQE